MNETIRAGLWPDGEFEPCPPDQPCENCGHRMMGHFKETADFYAVACHECDCQRWCCKHGGIRL
jgi:hypothetical protein